MELPPGPALHVPWLWLGLPLRSTPVYQLSTGGAQQTPTGPQTRAAYVRPVYPGQVSI